MLQDHFLLIGPMSNPAGLVIETEDVLVMFNKIVAGGNADLVVSIGTEVPIHFNSNP